MAKHKVDGKEIEVLDHCTLLRPVKAAGGHPGRSGI